MTSKKDCLVRVASASGGEERSFSANGTFLCRDGIFSLSYRDDGDAVSLMYSGEEFSMERRGALGLRSRFRPWDKTELRLALEGGEGVIPVFTNVYRVSANGRRVVLGYRLSFDGGEANFLLKIEIFPKE